MVKVIVEPVYLDGSDGFIDLAYYDAIVGCHLGLFPSYYEPWGYTPLESAALGVPALTTDLSGYGMYISKSATNKEGVGDGIYVLERYNKDENTMLDEFFKVLYAFSKSEHADRVSLKLHAKNVAANCDWKFFVLNYINAHNLALEKISNISNNK